MSAHSPRFERSIHFDAVGDLDEEDAAIRPSRSDAILPLRKFLRSRLKRDTRGLARGSTLLIARGSW